MDGKDFVTFFGIIATFTVGFVNLILSSSHNKKTRYIETITSERIKWINTVRSLLSEYLSMVKMYDYKQILESNERDNYLQKLDVLTNKIILSLNPKKDIAIIQIVKELNEMTYYTYFLDDWLKIEDQEERIKKFFNYTDKDFFNYFMKELNIDVSLEDNTFELLNSKKELFTKENVIKYINKYNADIDLRNKLRNKNRELSEMSQQMLKKEWDRVKLESEHGDSYSFKD